MKRDRDVMARARRVNPVPPDAFADLARSPEGQEILHAILQTTPEVRSARRSHRRAIGGLIAATVLVSAGTVAAAVMMSRPDPKQSAQVVEDFSSEAKVHLAGWRPELGAEEVVCLFPEDGTERGLDTFASDFPLEQQLTPEELARECTERNDWVSKLAQDGIGPFSVDEATLCISEEGAYPKAVVGVDGIDCTTTPVEDFVVDEQGVVVENGDPVLKYVQARAMTLDDLKVLNNMRAIEVAVLAVPSENGCPTREQATEWAEARLGEFGVSGLDINSSGGANGCYRGRISWDTGFSSDFGEVWIDIAGNQPSDSLDSRSSRRSDRGG